jgi:hypothetical protein
MKYILPVILALVLADAAVAQPRIGAVPQRNYWRSAGDVNLHAGVGSSNGGRLGLRYGLGPSMSAEASVGYVQLKQTVSEPSDVVSPPVDGYSISGGINYLTHPANDISPMLSLILSYNDRIHSVEDRNRNRLIVTMTVGANSFLFWRLDFFFRAGPSVHFLPRSAKNNIQMFVQFDGGIGISF